MISINYTNLYMNSIKYNFIVLTSVYMLLSSAFTCYHHDESIRTELWFQTTKLCELQRVSAVCAVEQRGEGGVKTVDPAPL